MASRYAVGFDFDHTLGIDNRLERTIMLETLARYAREHDATYDVAAATAAMDGVLNSFRVGTLTPEIALASFIETFVPVHGAAVMDAVAGFRDAVVARVPEFVTPVEGAREVLAALVEMGVPVALLTNGWSPLQEEKARAIAFPGSVYVSERIGVRKPGREAFALLANHFACAPEDIFFVGDDPIADCGGANDAGMQSVWFDWENVAYPSDLAAPKHTIHKLMELPALLQGRD